MNEKEKQIEEMARAMCDRETTCKECPVYICRARIHAANAYKAGYRKPDWCPLVDATDTNVGHKSEWISVEERLPEKEGKYLICTDRGYVTFGFFGNYDGNGNLTILRNNPRFDYRNVIYWMPLPEPPDMKGGAE